MAATQVVKTMGSVLQGKTGGALNPWHITSNKKGISCLRESQPKAWKSHNEAICFAWWSITPTITSWSPPKDLPSSIISLSCHRREGTTNHHPYPQPNHPLPTTFYPSPPNPTPE